MRCTEAKSYVNTESLEDRKCHTSLSPFLKQSISIWEDQVLSHRKCKILGMTESIGNTFAWGTIDAITSVSSHYMLCNELSHLSLNYSGNGLSACFWRHHWAKRIWIQCTGQNHECLNLFMAMNLLVPVDGCNLEHCISRSLTLPYSQECLCMKDSIS